jgi:hypothetical protein
VYLIETKEVKLPYHSGFFPNLVGKFNLIPFGVTIIVEGQRGKQGQALYAMLAFFCESCHILLSLYNSLDSK